MKTTGSYTGTIIDACDLLGVSRSGYYNYLNSADQRETNETMDLMWKKQIEQAYHYRKYDKGSRGIVMYFYNNLKIIVNSKRFKDLCGNIQLFVRFAKRIRINAW